MSHVPGILVIGHDPRLQESLRSAGFEPILASALGSDHPGSGVALVVADCDATAEDSLDLCRRLRATQETANLPLVLLASAAQALDVARCLEAGADDFVRKPYHPRELVARLRTVLRRTHPSEAEATRVVHGPLRIDGAGFTASLRGEPLPLTATEFRLLHLLASHPGRVYSRDWLLTYLNGPCSVSSRKSINLHVFSIRKKLGNYGGAIETVRSVGYRFRLLLCSQDGLTPCEGCSPPSFEATAGRVQTV